MKRFFAEFSIDHPWWVIIGVVLITAFFAAQLPDIKIDTDPENMLPSDEPVRLFDHQTKEDFALSDFIAVGVVTEQTAFTPGLLNRIFKITSEIEEIDGVIAEDILAPSTVDDISQGFGGSVVISTLMEEEIETQQEADYIFSRIMANPVLRGKLASDDGRALAIFIPIESKNMSHRIGVKIQALTEKYGGAEVYYVAGLPIAEDSFGAEMFVQMAYSAPMAMMVILLLMLLFFRKFKIVIAPLIVAMMSVIWTMGLLILTGNTVHIMSSMIPIFLMPISVLDSVHIISEFHDNYQKLGDKAATIRYSILELFQPMLFTSLTTVAGFLSLALTPIPPVQVFGIFVAFGIVVAWLLSMTLVPAVIMLIEPGSLETFGSSDDNHGPLAAVLRGLKRLSYRHSLTIIFASAAVIVVAGFGITKIEVNDNPVRWFKESHPVRQADVIMNRHLAGTYMNYLVFDAGKVDALKNPEILAYIESLQEDLARDEIVGATTGLPDIVKKVRYELYGADAAKASLPDNREEIAQLLFLFEISGGNPDDLYKFVTEDYDKGNLWVQLTNGDNKMVSAVVERVAEFIYANPPPAGLKINWAGLPFINITWQDKMVAGMGKSLMWAYLIVFAMMVFLFRSIRWGFISLLPLTVTIIAIYGFIGYWGRSYDMPVAVLSSLALGLSVDFAIHNIQRFRMIYRRRQNFAESFEELFQSTGRAIGRNVMIIAIGFVPMLFSSLVPYITVGAFFLAIMIISGLVTMLLLPAISKIFRGALFKGESGPDEIDQTKTESI